MEAWLAGIVSWTYFAAVVLSVITVLLRKKEPASALGWSLAIVFIPVVGIGLFLLVGWDRVSGRLRKKIEHRREFPSPIEEADFREADFLEAAGGPAARASKSPEISSQWWDPVERLLQDLGQAPRRGGNRVELYSRGVTAFEEMEAAIRSAKHHIHVEFFIFRNDELGRRATAALVERARAGVEVRVLVDGVGSRGNRHLLRELRRAGGRGVRFLPLRIFGKATPHLRNHRKIVIVDGRIAFFGGLNIGVEYLGRRRNRGRDWFDLHVRLEGPSVLDLQEIFLEDWDFAHGDSPDPDPYFPTPEQVGDAPVQVIAGGPDQPVNAIRQAVIAAFTRARSSIRVLTPYLVPDLTIRDSLMIASRAGLDVEIITQFPPADHMVVQLCGEHAIGELLEAGVRVSGYADGMMHAKAMVIDGEWGMIGSANLDNRSLHLNFEQMAVLDGATEIAALEEAIEALRPHCREYTQAYLDGRPWTRRLLSNAARLLAPIL